MQHLLARGRPGHVLEPAAVPLDRRRAAHVFGDSSVGQAYWDAAGVGDHLLFAYRVVVARCGIQVGLLARAITAVAMFLLGPALEFVGFGLSEISSAAFIYLASFFADAQSRRLAI
jgi:hypothetical protein